MSVSHRLYYDDPMIREFSARVTACVPDGEDFRIALDRTAFYAEAGGQPWDEGTLQGEGVEPVRVFNVQADKAGEIWHFTASPLPVGLEVRGKLDWDRRQDHMEQHAGEHMLANALWQAWGGVPTGLHTGREDATIDVDIPGGKTHLTADEIVRLEETVNARIRRNEPIKCYFPDPDQLRTLPLRKRPTVSGHIRIVQIGTDEYCPCGGTHPPFTGMVGAMKILDAAPSRGKLRIRFVCGGRVLKSYRALMCETNEAVRIMNAPAEKLAEACEASIRREKEAREEIERLNGIIAARRAEEALKRAVVTDNGLKIVTLRLEGGSMKDLTAWAMKLTEGAGTAACCYLAENGGMTLAAAASEGTGVDLRPLLKQEGARGGGRDRLVSGRWETDLTPEAFSAFITGKITQLAR